MGLKRLNKRHIHFIEHYTLTKNATESAKIAGYSPNSAGEVGCRMLKDPLIAAEVDKRYQEMLKGYDLTRDELVKLLAEIAQGKDDAAKSADRIRATELIMKEKGLLKETEQHTHVTFSSKIDKLKEKRRIFDSVDDDGLDVTNIA